MNKFKPLSGIENHHVPVKICLAGERATGKTRQLAFAANEGFKTFMIDLNGENYASALNLLTDEGKSNFYHMPIYPEYDAKGKPDKSNSTMVQLNQILLDLVDEDVLEDTNTIVAIDGLSDLANALVQENQAFFGGGKDDKRVTALDSWNSWNAFNIKVQAYTRFCNLVTMGHITRHEFNDGTSKIGFDFISKNYGCNIVHSEGMTDLYVMEKLIKRGKETEYRVITAPTADYPFVKSSSASIPSISKTDNFLPNAIRAIKTGKWE